ncbi:MAG TPA: glycogen synthase GlgA [Vicinamibacteria bacterium]|nr:glycogen synthase GlgA [Vicinamibacteria bacterium]
MPAPLHVAYVTSEIVPYAKTGGLGDVGAALPKALVALGHRVTVFLPRYGGIAFPPGEFVGSVHVPVDSVPRSAGFYRATNADGVEVVFVEHPAFFDRAQLYGEGGLDYADNRLRFAFLSRAAIEYFRSRGERPSVFHAHDWQAGLVPVYLKAFYWDDPTLHRMPSLFTIHNASYQGVFGSDTLGVLGLPWNLGTADALEYHGGVSYLKGGILFSEILTAVSPQYAREIQGDLGYSMDGPIRSRAADLVGILNGVDYDEWDPAVDTRIAANYTPLDLGGKATCKADLLRSVGLPEFPDLPVIGVTSRLVHQKGFDVVVRAWYDLVNRPLRMVVLGSGEPDVENGFRALELRAPDRFAARVGYDTGLAHKIQAGADMFLMPSRFEPCGLTQMYALRYGTVPIVRATGGLVDTVEPWDAATRQGTGFRFAHADGTGMMWAIDQAVAAWQDREAWSALQRNGMKKDFSWERSARAYEEAFRRAMSKV